MLKELANKIRAKYDVRDIDSVAASENIDLISIKLPESIKGIYYAQNGYDIIAINCHLNRNEMIETFWHEYYHFLLSVGNFISAKYCLDSIKNIDAKDERNADRFVALLLIENIDIDFSIEEISEKWEVSNELASLRLELETKVNI